MSDDTTTQDDESDASVTVTTDPVTASETGTIDTETDHTPTRHTPSTPVLMFVGGVGIGLPLGLVGAATAWSTAAVVPAAVAAGVAFWLGAQIAIRQEATA